MIRKHFVLWKLIMKMKINNNKNLMSINIK